MKDENSILLEEYRYDPSGTRNYEMNTRMGIPGRTLAYSDDDQLQTLSDGLSYQYDTDGFLKTRTSGQDVTEYAYSSRGELLNVILPDGRNIDYIHDPLGRRIAKKTDSTVTEKYLWQGRTRLLAVYDGSDSLIMRFEYADTRMPASMTANGSVYYFAYDQAGSPRIVTDSSGNVVKKLDYDSFGNVYYDSNPEFEIPFGFAGGLYDRDTGLLRFGHRDYDPEVGRWTAKDPAGFAAGDTDLYGYCLNDPVNFTDPLGLLKFNEDRALIDGKWVKGEELVSNYSSAIYYYVDGCVTYFWGKGYPILQDMNEKDWKSYLDEKNKTDAEIGYLVELRAQLRERLREYGLDEDTIDELIDELFDDITTFEEEDEMDKEGETV